MQAGNENRAYGCLYCRTGFEHDAVQLLETLDGVTKSVVPTRLRYRRFGGNLHEEQIILFPGYVFFEADEETSFHQLLKRDGIYYMLMTDKQEWQLKGSDEALVMKLLENEGQMGISRAYMEGDRIHIVDGFLKGNDAKIIRVNHRSSTAQVVLTLCDKEFKIWLGYELIEPGAK